MVDEKREREKKYIVTYNNNDRKFTVPRSFGKERSSKRESIERERENAARIIEFFKSSFSRNLFPSKMTVFQINMFAKVCVALWALVKRILKGG